ncbi:MAG TPA: xanthine dehydrogenase family protein molybdopterin-binding subunit [Gemmatimonadaceae bacterium]|nr:xanthine dehydrogenase family protein molybdopterin-binding subunit [Gemmatimonadaceae bacterium]
MADKRFVVTKVEVEGREETKVVEVPDFDPAPWTADTRLDVVGTSVPRMDALEKVTGRAVFTADIQRAWMLHTAVIRAPVAHGRVLSIDFGPALEVAGVRAVLGRAEVDDIRYDSGQLFDETIRFAGQPLAAVCAETANAAERAARATIVRVDTSPHAVTAEDALAVDAPLVRSKGNASKNSPRVTQRGDVDAGLQDADVVVHREFRTPSVLHTAMEPHGAVAEWNGDHVTIWESTQGIFNTRSDVAEAFGLKLTQVRVIKDYMGGGFGAKNGAHASTYIAVALAKKTGAPVRCVYNREGEQTDAGNRSATSQRVTIGAKRDGTLTAIQLHAEIALGVSGWFAGPGKIYHELYACPNVRTTEVFAYTHTGAMASFRAPGHVEGAVGLECTMDAVARELGMDPLDLRRRNYASRDQEKDRRYSDKNLDRCYDEGAQRFDWSGARAAATREPATTVRTYAAATGPRVRRGVGVASVSWGAGGGPPAYATVRLNPDGTVDVLTGSQDLGTGARTVFAQIAAETLGADVSTVRTVLGDTERLPYTGNSWGSQTTASVGPAVRMAAEAAREKLFDAAAQFLDTEPQKLVATQGIVRIADDPARAMTFAQVGEKLGDVMIIGQGMRGPNPKSTALSAFAAHFAEIEVNLDTGQVHVLRFVAAHDSGRIINPRLAQSQLEGGILQGIGFALFEERIVDRALGLPLNPTMHDYKVPTLADTPVIDAFFVDSVDVVANHTGAKGLAEPPIIGVAPAIANAVANAIGVEVLELPLTPWRVLKSLSG